MKTLKQHNHNKWGVYTERKACIGEIQCTKAQAERIQNGLMTDEINKLKGQTNDYSNIFIDSQ